MAQSRLELEDLISVSCAMAQRSCAWRKMNLWELVLDLEAAPWRKRPAPLRSCNCLFAPRREGLRMAQLNLATLSIFLAKDQEDDARIKQGVDDVQEEHGTLSNKVESSR
ncbi:hypothetical protein L195_g047159 [Trifolium pratense]|uniref:Uncharacterized protein n=3 Tax=Trifolium pratense TaxID=57577 RepID=A0A2K3MJP1_TRIPR|nr:hypothetical protein L195_g047159 [Trifolium pratense]